MLLSDLPLWFVRTFVVAFGLLWGSFLNVVIYRVPLSMSVVRPGSRCPACGEPIGALQNIPILSYALLRGRARCCRARISPRYPFVEAIGGVLALAIFEVIVLRLPPGTSMGRVLAIFTAHFALALALVAAAFIDMEYMYLPDGITYGGAVLGFATSSFREMTFAQSLIGGAVGFGVVWLPFIFLYPKIRDGRVGMGLGDAKLLMLAGMWFGLTGAFFVLGAGAIQATVVALLTKLVRGDVKEPAAVIAEREALVALIADLSPDDREEVQKELAQDPLASPPGEGFGQARLAFGPFLALAMLEFLLIGRETLGVYFPWLGSE